MKFMLKFTLFLFMMTSEGKTTMAMETDDNPKKILSKLLTLKFTGDNKTLLEDVEGLQPSLHHFEREDFLNFIKSHQVSSEEDLDVRLWLPQKQDNSWTIDELKNACLAAAYFPWHFEEKPQGEIMLSLSLCNWRSHESLRKNLCLSCYYGHPKAIQIMSYYANVFFQDTNFEECQALTKSLETKNIKEDDCTCLLLSFGLYNEEFIDSIINEWCVKDYGVQLDDAHEKDIKLYFQYMNHLVEHGHDHTDLKQVYFL